MSVGFLGMERYETASIYCYLIALGGRSKLHAGPFVAVLQRLFERQVAGIGKYLC